MRVAFIQNMWDELQGPLLLSEILEREGHEIRFFFQERGWLKEIFNFSPQVVAISATTGNHLKLLKIAEQIKEFPNAPLVVMGGPHPTFFPEAVEHQAIDVICRGEGEEAFPRLLREMEGDRLPLNIPNLWVKQNGEIHKNDLGPLIEDLDKLPIPRREHHARHKYFATMPFRRAMVGRGCPYNCTFCFNESYRELVKGKGHFFRRRSVEHVMEEMRYLKRRFGFSSLQFDDDLFILNKKWTLEFAERYKKEINTPWLCSVHAKLTDTEIARALKDSGCSLVGFAIESGNPRVRREILNKDISDEEIINCGEILHKHGIPFQTFNMVGLPEESLEDAFNTVKINRVVKPFFAWCSLASPFPRTRFAELCREKGLLPEDIRVGDMFRTSIFEKTPLRLENPDAFTNLQKFFPILVKHPGLEPGIRPLLKLPPNALFRFISQGYFGINMKRRNNLSWSFGLQLYLRNRNHW